MCFLGGTSVTGTRSLLRGTPILAGYVPVAKTGWVPIARTGWVPQPGQDGVLPARKGMGYPLARTGVSQDRMGYPLGQVRMGNNHPPSLPARTGVSRAEQQSKHLLRGGRYASCLRAEGLSCFM